MNLTATELPDEIRDWPAWLESQVVGSQLRFLVGQLETISGSQLRLEPHETWEIRLRSLLTEELSEVLENGLRGLSEKSLRELIRQPRTLLALQELVFVEGGEYWNRVPLSGELDLNIVPIKTQSKGVLQGTRSDKSVELRKPSPLTSRRTIAVVAALAATVLIAFFVMQPSASNARYFARVDLLTNQGEASDFLRSLSRAIDQDWRTGREKTDLKSEIRVLRDSCDSLLAAELAQLDTATAADLKQRCQKWRDTLTSYIVELDSGEPEDLVRKKADETVQKLVIAIENLG